MAIAALVLGILGTILSIIPGLFWGGVPISLLAAILGIVGYKIASSKKQSTGIATAGIVIGIVGVAIGVTMYVVCNKIKEGAEEIVREIDSNMEKNTDDEE